MIKTKPATQEYRNNFDAIFKKNKGVEYLLEASQNARQDTFNYYYGRLKKFTFTSSFFCLKVRVVNSVSTGLNFTYLNIFVSFWVISLKEKIQSIGF